ncbi:MAG: SpoIIE family protein phosphatase, partial [Myxococcales bacterium]|nr:SpoIIE family protein phosphatase [Myxococcales bacterium]
EMPRVQVVMVTGEGTLETAIEALRAGAWDFVTKPVRSGELLCRVVDRALERAELLRENERQRKRLLSLNEELTRAVEELRDDQLAGRTLQRQLLPPERAELAPFNVEHRLFASRYLSGDFVDYFPLGDERVGFYVADVAGHGAASAFVTAMVSALVGGYREAYGAGRDDTVVHPARLLARLNGDLLARRMEKHVCLFYGVLSRTAPRVTYSSAGFFPYPMLHRAQGGLEMLELPSVPLALFPDSEYVAAERTFGPGDALLVASDGVAEDATQAQSERLGQVARAFMESQDLDELAARLALGEAAVGERALTDDVTLFLCRRGGP